MSNLYGLIGERLGHSFSPKIHTMVFESLNIDGYYHLFELSNENLKDGIKGLKTLGAKGVNVTIPYKVKIMKYLDDISEEAKKIGAVNTIVFKDNKLIGYNTDYYGFGMTLNRYKVDILGKNALILGTGGVSRAVYHYLLDNGINDITFVSRDVIKGKEKYGDSKVINYSDIKSINSSDIVINCTPIGMYPNTNDSPIDIEDMFKFNVVIDLVYNPLETLFLKNGKNNGLKTINGLYMLVGQGIKAQELWNEIKIDNGTIDNIYKALKI